MRYVEIKPNEIEAGDYFSLETSDTFIFPEGITTRTKYEISKVTISTSGVIRYFYILVDGNEAGSYSSASDQGIRKYYRRLPEPELPEYELEL